MRRGCHGVGKGHWRRIGALLGSAALLASACRSPRAPHEPGSVLDRPLNEESFTALFEELRRANEEADTAGFSTWIEGALQQWAGDPNWPRMLTEAYDDARTWNAADRRMLTFLARSWLAVSFSTGRYEPDRAAEWSYSIVRDLALRNDDHGSCELVRETLDEERAEAHSPQLLGLERLDREILAALPAPGRARDTLLSILGAWCRARGHESLALLEELRRSEAPDLRVLGFVMAIWIEPGLLHDLRFHLADEEMPVIVSVCSNLSGIPRVSAERFFDLLAELPPQIRAGLPLAILGRILVSSRLDDCPSLVRLARSAHATRNPAGREIRAIILYGLATSPPDPQVVEYVFDETYEPDLPSVALQTLAWLDPERALVRHWELLGSPDAGDRAASLASLQGLLRYEGLRGDEAFRRRLAEAAEDPRLDPTSRELARKAIEALR